MFKLISLFKLPSPKDLGWSENNCLPMNFCKFDPDGKSWEEYDEKMKKEYPFKFWLNKTLTKWFTINIRFPIIHHWLRFKDWRNNNHLVDLRKAGYKFQGLLPSEFNMDKILQANMAVLVSYIEKYKPIDPETWLNKEDIKNCQELQLKTIHIQNLYAIYNYWKKERPNKIDQLNILWIDYKKNKTQIEIAESYIKYKDTEMLKLLIDSRVHMFEIEGYS
jgi:hypothetical protein